MTHPLNTTLVELEVDDGIEALGRGPGVELLEVARQLFARVLVVAAVPAQPVALARLPRLIAERAGGSFDRGESQIQKFSVPDRVHH